MTSFVWTDRDRRQRELDSPALIEAEATAIAEEMDHYIELLGDPSGMIRDPARAAIGKLQLRLAQLRNDLARWNAHAMDITRAEAARLIEQIDKLPTILADVLLVVALHDENDRIIAATAAAPEKRPQLMPVPMTPLQRRAIVACASRVAPPGNATREEAKTWLDGQPRFARRGAADDGWFAWTDRNKHAHRLVDPLAIETEVAVIASELADLRPALAGMDAPSALDSAVITGFASWERLQILQGDLERFDREATAREDAAWDAYAADWRSKRKMQ